MKKHFWVVSLVLLIACKTKNDPIVSFLEVPETKTSSESNLHLTRNNDLLLTWIENGAPSKFLFSKLEHNTWSQPKLITEGNDWFVNWADFPSMISYDASNLATYILDKSAEDTYAYDIKMLLSKDNGNTWETPFKLHKDTTHTEHGFVSMDALSDGKFLSVWLDGRNFEYHKKDSTIAKQMTLRSAQIDANGHFLSEYEIDNRVCECCQTDLVSNGKEALVVYRNRSEKEVRDIYYSKFSTTGWSEPKALHNDNWNIVGCPVNGPRIDGINSTAAVVWFTLNDTNIPTIKHSFSTNFGDSFSEPTTISHTNPLGRVDIKLLDEKTSVITWMESIEGKTVIYLQKIFTNGTQSEKIEVTQTSKSRSSGFPRLAIKDHIAYITWTEASQPPKMRLAKVNLEQIK